MKSCTTCKALKPITEFNKNKTNSDGLNSVCRVCSGLRSRQYYQDNKEAHKLTIASNKAIYISQLREWINQSVKQYGCSACNEKEFCCLEFHHIHQEDKEYLISILISTNSRKKLEIELNKCAVVCSNCHRKIHAKLIPNPVDKQLRNVRVPKSSKHKV